MECMPQACELSLAQGDDEEVNVLQEKLGFAGDFSACKVGVCGNFMVALGHLQNPWKGTSLRQLFLTAAKFSTIFSPSDFVVVFSPVEFAASFSPTIFVATLSPTKIFGVAFSPVKFYGCFSPVKVEKAATNSGKAGKEKKKVLLQHVLNHAFFPFFLQINLSNLKSKRLIALLN